jgi:hypothetical protein
MEASKAFLFNFLNKQDSGHFEIYQHIAKLEKSQNIINLVGSSLQAIFLLLLFALCIQRSNNKSSYNFSTQSCRSSHTVCFFIILPLYTFLLIFDSTLLHLCIVLLIFRPLFYYLS